MHMSEVFELGLPPAEQASDADGECRAGDEENAEEGSKKGGGRGAKKAAGGAGVEVTIANGDEVSFNVVENKQDGRLNAVRVLKLPKASRAHASVFPGQGRSPN